MLEHVLQSNLENNKIFKQEGKKKRDILCYHKHYLES